MARLKIDDDFFSDFNIFTADELNEMDFFLSSMLFFEKGVLEKKDSGNSFFLIVPKSEQLPGPPLRAA